MIRTIGVLAVVGLLSACSTVTQPSASAAPSLPLDERVVAGFIDAISDSARSFRLAVEGDVSAGGFGGAVSTEYQIEGRDLSGSGTVAGYEVEYLLVDGVAYGRLGGQNWFTNDVAFPDPLDGLTVAEVTFVGPADGLYELAVADPGDIFGRVWNNADLLDQATVSTASLAVFVSESGTPARAQLRIEGTLTGPPGGDLAISLDWTYSDWGAAFGIALPPELVPTPEPTDFVPPIGLVPASSLTGRLAISSDWGGGNYALVVVDPDGSNGHAWLEPAGGSYDQNYGQAAPAWSPDGRQLAISHQSCPYDGDYCINRIAIVRENGTLVDITPPDHGVRDTNPTWSPDGSRIMFESNRGAAPDAINPRNLFVINVDGSGLSPIATDLTTSGDPDWSPDGSLIVFEGSMETDQDGIVEQGIYVAAPDGSGARLVAAGFGGGRGHPVWSPDGQQIGWSRYSNTGQERLVVMNADGSNPVDLVPGYFRDWSPDGRVLLYMPTNLAPEAWVCRADGAGPRLLLRDPSNSSGYTWAPYPRP